MTGKRSPNKFIFSAIIVFLSLFLLSCGSSFHATRSSTNPVPEGSSESAAKNASVEGTETASPEECLEIREAGSTPARPALSEKDLASAALEDPPQSEETGEDPKREEQETIDTAMELINRSQEAWEGGDLENALDLLDQAYASILNVDGHPDIAWQKDDLRYMISKRILEIYASRNVVTTGYQSEIPHVMNADVENEIRIFQKAERSFFRRSYERSGLYRPMILEKLKKAGLPEELSWLPLVESGFKVQALSSARALGLWQIIPSTGYKFGMKRDYWIDERMDVEKSTDAAIAYLKELHGIFGDWLSVLAAYNCGEGRVLRVISRQHTNYLDNFWDLYHQLPYETARYVPRFLATLRIIEEPEKYGMDLPAPEKDIDSEVVTVTRSMRLKDIAGVGGIPEDALCLLNPQLRYRVTPDTAYGLKIPSGSRERLLAALNDIPVAQKPQATALVMHRVKPGEYLSGIARKYNVSQESVVRANHLSSKHVIRAGRILKIPTRGYVSPGEEAAPSRAAAGAPSSKRPAFYTVNKGDSLWNIARRFGTTVSEIKRINGLADDHLQIGQVIRLGGEEPVASSGRSGTVYTVKQGDSLFQIARTYRLTVDDLLDMNGLNPNGSIHPGQKIMICR